MPVGNNPFDVNIDPRSDNTRTELPPPAPMPMDIPAASTPPAEAIADYTAAQLDTTVSPERGA